MVGSAGTHNGFLYLKTTKMYVLLHETVGSTEPTDGFLDPAMQETLVLLHETEGSEDPINGMLRPAQYKLEATNPSYNCDFREAHALRPPLYSGGRN